MKKNLLVNSAVVSGLLLMCAVSASAAESTVYCLDKQANQQFTQETAPLIKALQAREIELRDQNTYTVSEASRVSSPDYGKINALEAEIKVLKNRIHTAAQKLASQCPAVMSSL